MPTRASKGDNGADFVQNAPRGAEEDLGESVAPPSKKNPHAVALSKLGASKGGKARAEKLSKKKRKEIARKAAAARWGKRTRSGF